MRLLHVVRKELSDGRKSLIVFGITIFMILFVQEILAAVIAKFTGGVNATASYPTNFPGFLYLGGFIMTSVYFSSDMFSKNGQHNWLMLPASSLEKFLAKALLTAVAYPLVLIAHFTLSSIVIETLALVFTGDAFRMYNPVSKEMGWMLLHYLVGQSVFLLGATYFRKVHFMKTILAILVLGLAASLLASLFTRIIFAPYFRGLFIPMDINVDMGITFSGNVPGMHTLEVFEIIIKVLYWALLAPFCWFVSYLRVKEVQATDAIQ